MKKEHNPGTLLLIKFESSDPDNSQTPIYELSRTFIALQRIIYKAHLFRDKSLKPGVHIRKDKKRELTLQLSFRERGSDLYGLAPFCADPAVMDQLRLLADDSLVALGAYAIGAGWGGEYQDLIHAIFNEVVDLSRAIGGVGGLKEIEISSPQATESVTIDISLAKGSLRSLRQRESGGLQELEGRVTSLNLMSRTAQVKSGDRDVRVFFLNPEDFDQIRYDKKRRITIVVEGRAILRRVAKKGDFTEFEAHTLKSLTYVNAS